MRIPAAAPALALLSGCAVGLAEPDSPTLAIISVVTLAVAAAVAVSAWRSETPRLLLAAVAAGFAAGGVLLGSDAWQRAWRPSLRVAFEDLARVERLDQAASGRPAPDEDAASVTLTGVVAADASATVAGASLTLTVIAINDPMPLVVDGGVALTVLGDIARNRLADWRAGRTVRLTAVLRRAARYLDPGVPDEERLLARRGITLVGTVKSGALVEVIDRGSFVSEAAGSLRAFAREAIGANVGRWSARAAAIVTAIVIGDRAGLDGQMQRELQEAGTYHVIAISGGNIAILAGVALGGFRLAGMLGPIAMVSAIVGLIGYAFLVGGGASVDRATLMAVVYLAGRAIDLRGPPVNALAATAGLLAAVNPLAVADPAFLLTFGASSAILLVFGRLPVVHLPRLVRPVAEMFLASAAAEAALLPVSASIFERVTFAGLVLNFAAIPLMAVAQLAGMLVVPLAAVSLLIARLAGWVACIGAEGLVRSAELVRFAPALTWRVAAPSTAAIVCYYASVLGAWWLWRRPIAPRAESRQRAEARPRCNPLVVLAFLSAFWIAAEPWRWRTARGDGLLHLTFIDVGQGDSAFVRLPRGEAVLVDAGGLSAASSFDVGDRVVAPVLRHTGVGGLTFLALTHGDGDHIGGAGAVIDEFKPHDVWEGIPVPPLEALRTLRVSAQRARSRWTMVQAGDSTAVGDVQIEVRHPGRPDWERQKVRNDDSIVLELLWRDVSVVLTGDIGREVEQQIAPQFAHVPLRIIKVPHHGSLTSSSEPFVRALSPRVAVVSAGRNNPFGHPAPAVLERYHSAGAEVFRTDRDGAVTIDTDGHSVKVHTFTGFHVQVSADSHHEGTKDTKH